MGQLLGILRVYVTLAVLALLAGTAAWTARSFRWKQVPEIFESMQPALLPSQLVRLDKRVRGTEDLKRGDVVAYLRDPLEPKDVRFGRVVALPGDRVEVKGGALWVNGERPDEPMVGPVTEGEVPEHRLPRRHVFVLVDRRTDVAEDSRSAGAIDVGRILGKARR